MFILGFYTPLNPLTPSVFLDYGDPFQTALPREGLYCHCDLEQSDQGQTVADLEQSDQGQTVADLELSGHGQTM